MKVFIDRCCARYKEISGNAFYFILTAADSDKAALERTVESFRGFTACLDDATEKGVLYATGLYTRDDIHGSPF